VDNGLSSLWFPLWLSCPTIWKYSNYLRRTRADPWSIQNDEMRFFYHTLNWSSCSECYLWITNAFSTRNNWSCSPQTINTSCTEIHRRWQKY
jgi:hypothetical protein